jgi:hypothetical protein
MEFAITADRIRLMTPGSRKAPGVFCYARSDYGRFSLTQQRSGFVILRGAKRSEGSQLNFSTI